MTPKEGALDCAHREKQQPDVTKTRTAIEVGVSAGRSSSDAMEHRRMRRRPRPIRPAKRARSSLASPQSGWEFLVVKKRDRLGDVWSAEHQPRGREHRHDQARSVTTCRRTMCLASQPGRDRVKVGAPIRSSSGMSIPAIGSVIRILRSRRVHTGVRETFLIHRQREPCIGDPVRHSDIGGRCGVSDLGELAYLIRITDEPILLGC